MAKLFIKQKKFLRTDFQPFMQHFVEACIASGFQSKPDIFPSYRYHIRSILCRILLLFYQFQKRFFPRLLTRARSKRALLIASNGGMILPNAFPYFCHYEIIPMLWDVWPHSWDSIYKAIRLFDIQTVFVSVRQVAEQLHRDLGIQAYWIPEGIQTAGYSSGNDLSTRPHDIIELGRQHPRYHTVIHNLYLQGKIKGYQQSRTNADGTLSQHNLAFPRFQDMQKALPLHKIMVCFPQCDTNPQRAGHLETLTQRYWEAMLSRCLMIGRAPQELIDLIGYNPVIDVDWEEPGTQLRNILEHIEDYQPLVDKNYRTACDKGTWGTRIEKIKEILSQKGFA